MIHSDEILVSARDLTKKYRIFASPKDRVKEALHPLRKRYHHDFCALKGISFDIPRGKILGILGRNGCGKSTLLQIIAGVLQPTSGTVCVKGNVAALLELGIGFHPEFTGRQNVILYGTIMGLSQEEMIDRLPEIEAFADIGAFFKQPVKTYSSGMFLRLAFAVAISINPEVMIIDEALAVGDARFQQRCLSKIFSFKQAGKTILFVSHDLQSVARICDQALLLEDGAEIISGNPDKVINKYLQLLAMPSFILQRKCIYPFKKEAAPPEKRCGEPSLKFHLFFQEFGTNDVAHRRSSYNAYEQRYGSGGSTIVDYLIVCNEKNDPSIVPSGSKIDLYVKVCFLRAIEEPMFGLAVKTKDGVVIFGTNTKMTNSDVASATSNSCRIIKFSFLLRVNEPDVFIDLGSAEFKNGEAIALDRRYSLIHLRVASESKYDGLTDLECLFEDLT